MSYLTVDNIASVMETQNIYQKLSHHSFLAVKRLMVLVTTWIFPYIEQSSITSSTLRFTTKKVQVNVYYIPSLDDNQLMTLQAYFSV